MDLSNLSDAENKALNEFTAFIEQEKYKEALHIAQTALGKFPTSKGIWHNQVGALISITEQDYCKAFSHYQSSLEAGFDTNTCEDNMWEAAEDFYNSLKDEDGKSFNAILTLTESGSHLTYRANHLINKYIEIFPTGRFIVPANKLLKKFNAASK